MRISLDLPTEPDSIPRARRALAQVRPTVDPATFTHLRLLVSELVTNAVRHVVGERAGDIHVTVLRTERLVRVEVADEGEGFMPGPRIAPEGSASGWGLGIVATVASRWGIENDGGARVWFEIDVPMGGTKERADRGQNAVA